MTDIVNWAQSKFGFYVDRSWRDGEWHLEKAPIVLADYHARILQHVFTPDASGRLPYDVVAIAEPAKSGKSAIAGLVHAYFALHVEPPAEQYVVSNKRDQAQSRVFKSLCQSFEWNPHLGIQPNRYELTTRAGTVVKAIPANARTESGARHTLVSFDEPAGIVYTDGERLIAEFKVDPTRTVSVQLFTGYGGYSGESNLWHDLLQGGQAGDAVDELADMDDGRGVPACMRNGRTFVFWSHKCRQGWQTDQWIKSQRASLRPAEFSRMIDVDFASSEGTFIDSAAWRALVDPEHKPLERGSPKRVYLGLDLATAPNGDNCALIGVYSEDNKVKIAFHKVWRGKDRRQKLKLKSTVYPYILNIAARYNLASVLFDPHQALSLTEDLRQAGVWCIEVPQTHASRGPKDSSLFQLAADGDLVLYPDKELENMAAGAAAKELGNGMIFLKKSGGRAKIDLLIALSNCADVARQGGASPGMGENMLVQESRWAPASTSVGRWTDNEAGRHWGRPTTSHSRHSRR